MVSKAGMWLKRPTAVWALCLFVLAVGAALFPSAGPARLSAAGAPGAEAPRPDPLLRSLYGGLRSRGVLPPRHRAPAQEAALSYIAAHEGRRPQPPPDTWGGLLRESLRAAGEAGERAGAR